MNASPRHSLYGFSLIEIMAAISILALLALIIIQITGSITHTTNLSNRAIDASTQARLTFDRIGMDLEGLVKRSDTDFLAQNTAVTGTPASLLLLVSSVTSAASTSATNNRGVSIIAYQVNAHADNQGRPCLIRSGKAIPWSNTGDGSLSNAGFMGMKANGMPVSFGDAAFNAFLPKTADFDVLAEGVIRMVVGFQLYPDNQAVTLADGTSLANARGQIVYSPPIRTLTASDGSKVNYIDLSRVSALVIGVVALDLRTLYLLDTAQVTTLGNAFPIPAAQTSPLASWSSKAENAAANPSLSTIPLAARQAVRVFERCYPVTPFAAQAP